MFLLGATSSKITTDLSVSKREEVTIESPQPNGMEKKQVVEYFDDLVTSFQYRGQTFVNTNVYKYSNATVRIVPEDTRRVR